MASKFKIRLKITGFELDLEGTRDEVAELTQSVGQQMSGLLSPGGVIIEGSASPQQPLTNEAPRLQDKRSRKKRSASSAGDADDGATAIDFRHDVEKFGMPRQEWKTAQKAMWLLHALKAAGQGDMFSTRTIFLTFNKHFKQAKTITTSNVTRDLGKAKFENPSLVGEDASRSPSVWFLTTEGERRVMADIASSASS
jgi:hypothetical protein